MTNTARYPRPDGRRAGLWRDLAAIRRYLWLPVASLAIAVVAALVLGALRPTSGEARFRIYVVVDALPPLFGPAVTPSPFDYARLATSDAVVSDVAKQSGLTPARLRPRLSAEARLNTTDINFKVTGPNALGAAHAWEEAFADAVQASTPTIERLLVQPYARQLDEARGLLEQQAAAAKVNPDDPVAQQQLAAAKENYATASKLSQSYDVVARTMKAQAFTVVAPHEPGAGLSSTAGRLAAAIAIGLLAGVIGALVLDYIASRPRAREAPEPIDARPAFRGRSERN